MNEDDIEIVKQQLQRDPEGFQEVVKRNRAGEPAIIRVASIVNGVPFPTLFWISDPELSSLIYRYESSGATQLIQELIDEKQEYRTQLSRDNEDYIRLREKFFDEKVLERLRNLGIEESFARKGIGGVANFSRVRCLHAYLAAHTVAKNIVGELLTSHYGPEDPLVLALGQLN